MNNCVAHQLAGRLELRAELANIVARHPELTSTEAQARLDAWLTDQEQSLMSEIPVVSVRLPQDLIDRVDDFVREQERKNPGMRVERSDGIRMLLVRALDQDKATAARKGR